MIPLPTTGRKDEDQLEIHTISHPCMEWQPLSGGTLSRIGAKDIRAIGWVDQPEIHGPKVDIAFLASILVITLATWNALRLPAVLPLLIGRTDEILACRTSLYTIITASMHPVTPGLLYYS
jgi:hypothetical protein